MSDRADSDASQAQAHIPEIGHSVGLSGVRNFSWLMGAILTLGVCVNVYLVWMSARRRLSVKWETFRFILRYSSLVDLSSCVVLALFVMLSVVEFHAGSGAGVSLQCGYLDLSNSLVYGGIISVSSGIVVAARQSTMLSEKDITIVRQNRVHVAKLIRDLLVVGIVFFLGAILMDNFGPVVRLPMCYVAGKMATNAILLLVAPIFFSALLGAVVIVGSTRTDNENKETHMNLDMSQADSAEDVECLATSIDDTPHELSDRRWNRFVIAVHVAVLTWFIMAAVMTLLGVLLQPVTASTLFVLTGITALISVWSAYALAMH